MRLLFSFFVLFLLVVLFYQYSPSNASISQLTSTPAILGSQITTFVQSHSLSPSDPLVNQTIANFSQQLKDLPKEQVEKIKYEFCKDIVEEYEQRQGRAK